MSELGVAAFVVLACVLFAWPLGLLFAHLTRAGHRRKLLRSFAKAHGLSFHKSSRGAQEALKAEHHAAAGEIRLVRDVVVGQWQGRELLIFCRRDLQVGWIELDLVGVSALVLSLSAPTAPESMMVNPIERQRDWKEGAPSRTERARLSRLSEFERQFTVRSVGGSDHVPEPVKALLLDDPARAWLRDKHRVAFEYRGDDSFRFDSVAGIESELVVLERTSAIVGDRVVDPA